MSTALIIGYGNPDRQDDGVAWHILNQLSVRLGLPIEEESLCKDGRSAEVRLLFVLQLTPDLAEDLAAVEHACFIDAHTGNLASDLNYEELQPGYQSSAFTHHMSAQTCLGLAQALYGAAPRSVLVSVRGYQFEFSHELSPATAHLSEAATERIQKWLAESDLYPQPQQA
jgi:hydrogenase maturation protease